MSIKIGDRFRVLNTSLTRSVGLNHGGRSHDRRAWPGMIGEVKELSYIDMDGNPATSLILDFGNGITYPLGSYGTLDQSECLVPA